MSEVPKGGPIFALADRELRCALGNNLGVFNSAPLKHRKTILQQRLCVVRVADLVVTMLGLRKLAL